MIKDSCYELFRKKHVIKQNEFGNISKNEYLQRAQDLVSSKPGGNILIKTRLNGDYLYYNITTNEFAVKTKEGVIRTYFKPVDGIEYFLKQ